MMHTFLDFAQVVESMPWPSPDADAVARSALETASNANTSREERVTALALLLWYVAVSAQHHGLAFGAIADRGAAHLSTLKHHE